MFKKIKHQNGKREIFIGNFRILAYYNNMEKLRYNVANDVENRLVGYMNTIGANFLKGGGARF